MAGTLEKMNKQEIRIKMLKKRSRIDKLFIDRTSKKIHRKLTSTDEFKKAKNIMFYVSKDNEVETRPMIENAMKNGKKISVPKTDRINHKLHPVMIKRLDTDLKLGHFGLHEPIFNTKKIVPINKIDLIITPGIAFDRNGNRLGWGKGYYDIFLEGANAIPKIGLAFDFQIAPELPRDKHDIPIDMVITEKRIINCSSLSLQDCERNTY